LAAAAHDANVSSAGIPAVFLVIAAIAGALPSRKSNKTVERPSGDAGCHGQKPDRTEARFIPQSYCKPFAIGR
jgi:hypothetical protein